MAQLILVHGVGGAKPASSWMTPLNSRLAGMGYASITGPHDRIILPTYGDLFDTRDPVAVQETYVKQPDRVVFEQHLEYLSRQKRLERAVRPHAESTDVWGLDTVPMFVANPLADLVEPFFFENAKKYVETPAVQLAVWRRVLSNMPNSGGVIVVAHSLGSVVAAGLLRRLPPGMTVDLLLTVGSPLSFPRYRSHLGSLWSGFPYARVRHWVNVYSPWDGVCGGRGISGSVPQAIDVCAHVDGDHDLEAYMSHPAVAEAIASVAFAPSVDEGAGSPGRSADRTPARPIHESWHPVLLGTAFTWQLAKSLPSGKWRDYLRLEGARAEVAVRAVADIATQRTRRNAAIAQARAQGLTLDSHQLRDHPLADGRYPDVRDLTFGAAALLRGTWTDEELLPLSVGLMIQPLVEPFDIQADSERRRPALERTINVVRNARGNLSDQAYAQQVYASVEWAKERLSDGGKFPWGTVLIASGLVVLAATGVGLAIAAPAGLAGAAVVTSTLAAFGPGGMVGGLLTLGVMTGTAGALGGLGVATELDGQAVRMSAAAAAKSGVDLAALPPDGLAVTLTGMVAVVRAQTEIDDFKSTEPFVRAVVTNALDAVRAERQLHEQIAPGTEGTKAWGRKATYLERALKALDSLTVLSPVDGLAKARKAIEAGKPPTELRPPPCGRSVP